MKNEAYRRLISEGAIGLSLVAGAYFFAVEPLQRSVAEARLGRDTYFLSSSDIDPVRQSAEVASLRQRVERVSRIASMTSDELAVMGRLNQAAEALGVQVQNIEKKALPAISPLADSSAPQPSPALPIATPKESRFGFSISATGTYAQMVSFLNTIQNDLGFTNIESMRVSPAGDTADQRVSMTIETSHWWFDATPAKAALAAGTQALAPTEPQP